MNEILGGGVFYKFIYTHTQCFGSLTLTPNLSSYFLTVLLVRQQTQLLCDVPADMTLPRKSNSKKTKRSDFVS